MWTICSENEGPRRSDLAAVGEPRHRSAITCLAFVARARRLNRSWRKPSGTRNSIQANTHASSERPDFVFPRARVAVFCDSHFWHGYRWREKQKEIKRNRDFWLTKIQGNIKRDREVNRQLQQGGWIVIRFWEHQILRSVDRCVSKIKQVLAARRVGV